MIGKLILGLVTALALVGLEVLRRYYSPDAKAARDRKARQVGHDANAGKDGKGLGRWWRERWKR